MIAETLTTVSVFDSKSISAFYEEIREVYLSDERPWIVGFSGGKDSTAALQLVWYAIAELPREKRTKPIYVISSDTCVETPMIVDQMDQSLQRMNNVATKQGLPFTATKVKRILDDSFWINMIGKGYPAPSVRFRWCTDRLKIKPANRFILGQVAQYGEVVLVLGVRRAESPTRAQVMNLHKLPDSRLSTHSTLPGAVVYTPIEDFSVNDVWTYLLQVPNPWGNDNSQLLALYQSAQSGECPLVIDKTTPSCGNSRFGCWVCTVIQKDKTMESLIHGGESWMKPMLDLRDLLTSTQNPEKKHLYRDYRRRTGRVHKKRGGGIIRGPYRLEFRKEILRRLLRAETHAKKNGPNPDCQLISERELGKIRQLWIEEGGDWQDSLPIILREETDRTMKLVEEDLPNFTETDEAILAKISNKYHLPIDLLKKLLQVERQAQSMSRRHSIFSKIGQVLRQEWRPESEFVSREV